MRSYFDYVVVYFNSCLYILKLIHCIEFKNIHMIKVHIQMCLSTFINYLLIEINKKKYTNFQLYF